MKYIGRHGHEKFNSEERLLDYHLFRITKARYRNPKIKGLAEKKARPQHPPIRIILYARLLTKTVRKLKVKEIYLRNQSEL